MPREGIAKSIIDVAKNTQSDSRIVTIYDIVPRDDNFNIKAREVNKEFSKICDKEKLLFLSHSNIIPKIHLNKTKLHLDHNVYEKLGNNFIILSFLNFIRTNYTWVTETNKKANIDIDVSSTSSTLNENSEIVSEIVDHITNSDLKSLCIRNLKIIVKGHLNINSIKNKFDFLAHQVKGDIDILVISETKLDESFPSSQFFLDGYRAPFHFDRNGNDGGISLYIRDDIPSARLKTRKTRKFFSEIFKSEVLIFAIGQNRKLGNKKTRNNISEISEISEVSKFLICHFSFFFFQKTFFFKFLQ